MFLQAAGETVTRYTLSKVYPREITRAHIEGDFHIHNLPFGMVGYCFDEQTRVLTEDGFKYFRDVTLFDKVATLNLKTGKLEYQRPIAKQVFHWDGELLHWRNKSVDLLVTPEHRMLVRTPTEKSDIERFKIGNKYSCPKCGKNFSKMGLAVHLGKAHKEIKRERRRAWSDWRVLKADELARRKIYEFKKDVIWKGVNREFFEFKISRLRCLKCACWIAPGASVCPQCGARDFKEVDAGLKIRARDFVKFLGWYIAEGNIGVSK